MKVRLANKRDVATDICEFELVSVDGSALPAFTAGAHIDVHVADGLIRQYSLCNAPGETHRYCVGVLRDPQSRGGSVG
ncbi:oxidoreductase, partial [Pandoraea pneumonica]